MFRSDVLCFCFCLRGPMCLIYVAALAARVGLFSMVWSNMYVGFPVDVRDSTGIPVLR